jgi:hypothetical protein
LTVTASMNQLLNQQTSSNLKVLIFFYMANLNKCIRQKYTCYIWSSGTRNRLYFSPALYHRFNILRVSAYVDNDRLSLQKIWCLRNGDLYLVLLIHLQTKIDSECLRIILQYIQSGHPGEETSTSSQRLACMSFPLFSYLENYVYFLLPQWTLGSGVWHFDDTELRVVTFCWAQMYKAQLDFQITKGS